MPEALVEGFLYAGATTSLAGGAKQGKSIVATQLGVCITTGTEFLDLATKRGKVVDLSGEMSAAMMRVNIRGIAQTLGIAPPSSA